MVSPWFAAGIAILPAIGLHSSGAGPTWTRQYPWPITGELVGIDFVDTTHGWVVGQGGLVASTSDGGTTWSTQKVAEAPEYYSVDFLDRNSGWIAGAAGAVLKTLDGGAIWQPQNSGVRSSLWHVRFANPDTGWIFGEGCILFTGDGGLHWTDRDTENKTDWSHASFLDRDTAWAVGSNGRIIKTRDGFKTWEEQGLANSTASLSHVEFLDGRTGWVLGSVGLILKTTNGGARWDTAVRASNSHYTSGHFFTPDSGIIVGREGQVCTLSGGGASIACEQPLLDRSMHEVIARPGNRLWMVGSFSVFGSRTDGKGFRYLAGGPKTRILDLAFADADSGVAAAEMPGFILRTTDGGFHWRPQRVPSDRNMESVFFLDAKTGWLCGGNPGGSALLKTTDGGVTWRRADTGITERISKVRFADADRGWAMTRDPVDRIFATVDGGAHWSMSPSAELGKAADMVFPTPQSGWAIVRNGAIFRTQDGGRTWTLQHTQAGEYLSALHFTSPERGWAVGTGGTLLRYSGSAWNQVPGVGDGNFTDIGFADISRGWIIEMEGGLLITRDGGEHWARDTTFPAALWTSLHVRDADHVWVGGDGIIKLGDPIPLGTFRRQATPLPSGRSGAPRAAVGRARGTGAAYDADGRKVVPGNRSFRWTVRPRGNQAD